MPILTDAEYAALAKVPPTEPAFRTTLLVRAACSAVEAYCGRLFDYDTYTEYYPGQGTAYLTLRNRPVHSVTSVHLDWDGYSGQGPAPNFDAGTLLVAGVDYYLDRRGEGKPSHTGLLVRVRGLWPTYFSRGGPQTVGQYPVHADGLIRVVYVAGYQPVDMPADLKLATAEVAKRMSTFTENLGILGSERLGDRSFELLRPPMIVSDPEMGSVRQLLAKYREVAW